MSYITREDGENFVIPSYRDVLSSKNKSQLKKDINVLSETYGEYITLQKKNATQIEVAFSPDKGYLLGETVWQCFNKPEDMVYCEAIPNSNEVILVVVKNSSVYLDGSFIAETVSEELVVFLTQQANFEIYTYGDVPISDSPEDGKFSFDPKSVKNFTVLDEPKFPSLPLIPAYQLDLAEKVLQAHGIGVLPVKQAVIVLILLGFGWFMWTTVFAPEETVIQQVVVNPYKDYNSAMNSPLPDQTVQLVAKKLGELTLLPGWQISQIDFSGSSLKAKAKSLGGKVVNFYKWSKDHGYTLSIEKDGYSLNVPLQVKNVDRSNKITNLEQVIAVLIDRVATVDPGNKISLGEIKSMNVYKKVEVQISIEDFTPIFIDLMGEQLAGLPVVVDNIKGTVENGILKGTIQLTALGS